MKIIQIVATPTPHSDAYLFALTSDGSIFTRITGVVGRESGLNLSDQWEEFELPEQVNPMDSTEPNPPDGPQSVQDAFIRKLRSMRNQTLLASRCVSARPDKVTEYYRDIAAIDRVLRWWGKA